jgi:hypothetical protein
MLKQRRLYMKKLVLSLGLISLTANCGAKTHANEGENLSDELIRAIVNHQPIKEVKKLIDEGADPNAYSVAFQGNALKLALQSGDLPLVETLVDGGARLPLDFATQAYENITPNLAGMNILGYILSLPMTNLKNFRSYLEQHARAFPQDPRIGPAEELLKNADARMHGR